MKTIRERIAEAVAAFGDVSIYMAGVPSPNVVYLGFDEAKELGSGLHSTVFSGAAQYIDGMRIIEVRLSNYLQVAYVEGVK